MNKEIDWHGKSLGGYVVQKPFGTDVWRYTLDGGTTWHTIIPADGAWPKQAKCPVGWDERDALV